MSGIVLLDLTLLEISDFEGNMPILASSVASHSSLTSLSFDSTLYESEILSLYQHLPDLTRLKSLHIQGVFRAPALAAFAHALWQLQSLGYLSIGHIQDVSCEAWQLLTRSVR